MLSPFVKMIDIHRGILTHPKTYDNFTWSDQLRVKYKNDSLGQNFDLKQC